MPFDDERYRRPKRPPIEEIPAKRKKVPVPEATAQSWETDVPGRGGFLETGKRIADRVLPEISVGGKTVVGGKPLFSEGTFSPREANASGLLTGEAAAREAAKYSTGLIPQSQQLFPEDGARQRRWVDARVNLGESGASPSSSSSPIRGSSAPSRPSVPSASGSPSRTTPFSEAGFNLRQEALKALGGNADRAALRSKVFELAGQRFGTEGNQTWNGQRMNTEGANAIADALYDGPMTKDGRAAILDGYDVQSVSRSPVESYERTRFIQQPGMSVGGKRVAGEITPVTETLTRAAAGPQTTTFYNPAKTGEQGFVTEREARTGVADASRAVDAEIGKAKAQTKESLAKAAESSAMAKINERIANGKKVYKKMDSETWKGLPSGVVDLFTDPTTGEFDPHALAEFSQFAGATGNQDTMSAYGDWQRAKKTKTPLEALQLLGQKPETRSQFKEQYGWLPNGY